MIMLLKTEFLKIKRTVIPWVLVLAPIIYGLLIQQLLVRGSKQLLDDNVNSWEILQQRFWPGLLLLFVPIFMALIIGVVQNLENKNDMWKILYTLPMSKTSVYIAKSIFSLLLIFLLFVLVASATFLIAVSINQFTDLPRFTDHAHNFWFEVMPTMLKAFGGSVLLWAIHNWLSYRFENFIISISIALVGSVICMIAFQGWKDIIHFPYAFPLLAISENSLTTIPIVWKSVGYGIVVFLLSLVDQKFFNNTKI